jgi:uncharacterized protein with von Willebrand factor type A (vWA) domain
VSHVFRRDAYDDLAFSWLWEDFPEIRALASSLGREGLEDVHASLTRATLEANPEADESPLKTALEEAQLTSEFQSLRARSRGDDAAAALATLELAKSLAAKINQANGEKDTLRVLAREGCARAARAIDAAEDAHDALVNGTGLCGKHEGTGRKTDRRALLDARDRVRRSPKRDTIRDILRVAGRMRSVCAKVRATRAKRGPGIIVGVEQGADPQRVLAHELVGLAPGAAPGLRLDFLRRFAEQDLAQFKTRADEKIGRGPIVMCLDESASMSGFPEVWSKALVLTMLSIACDENREFALIPFGSPGQARVWRWTKRPSMDDLLAALEFFYNGGTCFETPLALALALDETTKSSLRKADVVFVTDGQCEISAEFKKNWETETATRETKIYTIEVGLPENLEHYPENDIEQMSHDHVRVPDLHADDDALGMAFSVGL